MRPLRMPLAALLSALFLMGPAFGQKADKDRLLDGIKRKVSNNGLSGSKTKPTKMDLPLLRLRKRTADKVRTALEAMKQIDEVALDPAKGIASVTFASEAECGLLALRKVLRKCGSDLDLRRLTFADPVVVHLGGAIEGYRAHKRQVNVAGTRWHNKRGHKLYVALTEVEGVKSCWYLNARSLELHFDGRVSRRTIVGLVARHGSREKGSAVVRDITWKARKYDRPKPKADEKEPADDLK